VSEMTKPNPPIKKERVPVGPVAPVRPSPQQVSVPSHATPTLRDRCMNETGRPGKPQPMCAPA
jgi:hypothetical protein